MVAPSSAVEARLGSSSSAVRRLAFVLMLASGFAGLAYEIVWTQQSSLWLGHESAGVFAVTAGFFGGLAAGALILGARIDRSRTPGLWYAAAEAVIAVWSLALAFFFAPVTSWLLHTIGANPSPAWHWFVAFPGIFLLLLPATAAMGATLPAMERILGRMRKDGTSIAGLYAFNTLGAVLGVVGAAFVLIPGVGLVRTAGLCAVLNLLCAAVALKCFARGGVAVGVQHTSTARATSDADLATATRVTPGAHQASATRATSLLAVTGLLGIGYEILVVRVLSQVAENTVYTFSILLAVYLVGTAIGASACHRWLSVRANGDAVRGSEVARDRLLLLVAGACLLGLVSLELSEAIKAWVPALFGAGAPAATASGDGVYGPTLSSASVSAAMASEVMLALTAFLLPTIAMGALFSYLATEACAAGVSFGRALGVNTLGAAVAPPLFGLVLVPAIGPKLAIVLIAAGYLALSSARRWRAPVQWASVGAGAALAIWTPSLAIVDVPEGGRVVSYKEGTLATVSIVEDGEGVASLHINNRQQEGSSATLFADSRQALLPILFHPAPHRVLFLGMGTGVTAWSAVKDPSLSVDVVELLPEVIEASAYFTGDIRNEARGRELHAVAADARRFVRASADRYDVIVSDNFHPARAGSGALYTVEHFQAVRERLAPGGLFCQWLPLHQLDTATLRIIVRTFTSVYPRGWAVLATNSLDTPVIGLVAPRDDALLDPVRIRQRMSETSSSLSLAQLGLPDDFALLGSFVAGPKSLARFGADAPLNTDDHPVVAYRAPRVTYAPDSLPRDRLISLLHEIDIDADELLATPHDAVWAARLRAYWTARNRFIEAGRDVRPSADVQRMLAQVREPLLSVLHTSPDFRPAYDPLLSMAMALSRTDVPAARELLTQLEAAQPMRTEAGEMLRGLPAPAH
jgi:spermidine synthase